MRDREFHSSKQVLEGKSRQLRQSGMGKRQNKARSLTEEKEEVMLEADRAECRARTEIFSHECSLLEEKGVWLISSSSLSSEDH